MDVLSGLTAPLPFSMHPLVIKQKPSLEAVIEHLKKELSSLRTGRASPALVEEIPVPAYDSILELKGLSSIIVQDAKTLIIEPWDKSLQLSIEKAIRDSGIGLNPISDGQIIRIVLPSMTEENRKQIVKVMREKLESARVRIRTVREEARSEIIAMERRKDLSEDEKYQILEELDDLTKEYIEKVAGLGERKEEEIMSV